MTVRPTQIGGELILGPRAVRATQVGCEVIYVETTVRVTQIGGEIICVTPGAATVVCDTVTYTTIDVLIGPTTGADSHEIFISTEASLDLTTATPYDVSLGGAPTSYAFAGLVLATDYYIGVRSWIGSTSFESAIVRCQTTAAGAAPAFVAVTPITATTAAFYPEVLANVLEVYYEWRLSSDPDWTTPIGTFSDTGPTKFEHTGTGMTVGVLHTVRVRFRYGAGLSYWTEQEWPQTTPPTVSSLLAGHFTNPPYPGWVITTAIDLQWTTGVGWSATEIAASTDHLSYDVLATSGLSGSFTFDPAAYSYAEDTPIFIRLTLTDGTQSVYLYTLLIIDQVSPNWSGTGVSNCLTASEWAATTIVGTGPVNAVTNSTDPYYPCSIVGYGGTNASIFLPSLATGVGPEGFIAMISGGAAGSGTVGASWWTNLEITGSFFGMKFIDEDGIAIIDASYLFGHVASSYICDERALSGQAIVGLSGPGISEGVGIQSRGFYPYQCSNGIPDAHTIVLSVVRNGGDLYDWSWTVMGASNTGTPEVDSPPWGTVVSVQSGQTTITGGLPCGFVVPYVGRVTYPGVVGYSIINSFSVSYLGTSSCGLPSGISPVSADITCDVICDEVTITPSALALFGATEILYEVSDDPLFGSVLYTDGWRAINAVPANEQAVLSILAVGNYYGRYTVRYGSSGAEETSEACTFAIIDLGISVWGGWRTAADVQGEDVVAAFSWEWLSGGLVTLTDESYDLDGTVVSWLWTFKTGAGVILGSSTDQNPTFDFGGGGSFTATLTVQSDDLSTDSVTDTIDLTSISPSPSPSPSPGLSPTSTLFPPVYGGFPYGGGTYG